MNKVIMYFLSKLSIYLVIKIIDVVFDLLQDLNRKLKRAFRKKKRELRSNFNLSESNEKLATEPNQEKHVGESCVGDCCGIDQNFNAPGHW